VVAVVAGGAGNKPANPDRRRTVRACYNEVPLQEAMEDAVGTKNEWFLVGFLAALFGVVLWYCITVWRTTPSMPVYANVIMGVSAVLALVAGCGLIALMYYSQRNGYDEPARNDRTPRK
jgi:hypothetical protein